MVSTREIVVPAREDRTDGLDVIVAEGFGAPAVRQGMAVAEALGDVVEGHDVAPAGSRKGGLERHIGAGDDADREHGPPLGVGIDGIGMDEPGAGPFATGREGLGIAVDDQGEVLAHGAQMVAGQPPEIAGPIERQRLARDNRSRRGWIVSDVAEKGEA